MRLSEFWYRMKQVYPDAETFANDMAISELGSMTIKEALATGLEPDEIWKILIQRDPDIDTRWK
ncbi:MAG: DUF3046 domain-containing protein [Candidatus Nanopelagicaceae bacterium]|jgi:hypothetical protein